MGNKVWLDSYPPGVSAEIGASPFSSLPDLLEETIRRFGDTPAFHMIPRSPCRKAAKSRDRRSSVLKLMLWPRYLVTKDTRLL